MKQKMHHHLFETWNEPPGWTANSKWTNMYGLNPNVSIDKELRQKPQRIIHTIIPAGLYIFSKEPQYWDIITNIQCLT